MTDSTTLIFALALGNLSLCAALFFYEFEQKKSLALSTWFIARQFQAGAWLLLYFRGNGLVPDPISIPLGYSILFIGIGLEAGAMWQAAERLRWRRYTYPALALSIGAFLLCYAFDPFGLRVVAGAIIVGVFYLSLAAALSLGWTSGSMMRRFLALSIGLLAVLVAARGILVLTMPAGWGWLSNGLLQAVSIYAFYLLMLLGGFGYLLLSREQLQKELSRLEVVDPVTDLPNRRGFFQLLAPWVALARRPGAPTALVLIDLDNFKRVNDSYGHPAGDVVLRGVMDVCRRQLRDSDQLGRLVGVEFALLLPRTPLAEAVMVAERIRAAVEASPVKAERAMVKLTASFGVTTIRADDTNVSLFNRADAALRAAKEAGRNTVIPASEPDATA